MVIPILIHRTKLFSTCAIGRDTTIRYQYIHIKDLLLTLCKERFLNLLWGNNLIYKKMVEDCATLREEI
jgi:hypothetical protein